MPPRAPPVDFGVLPFIPTSSYTPQPYMRSLTPHQRFCVRLSNAFALKTEWTGVQWNVDRTIAMDYNCGDGTITQIFAQYVRYVFGVDPSKANVDQYNLWASAQRHYGNKITGYEGDLHSQFDSDPRLRLAEFFNLDVVVIGPGLYQYTHPQFIIAHLLQRLKYQGTILIIDYESQYPHCAGTPGHRLQYGWSKADLMGLLANSGFVDVAVENLTDSQGHKIVEENGQRRMIIARGVRRW